jgi:hypothetical protein
MTARYPVVLSGATFQELQIGDTLAGQAASGANSDITSLTGLTTALSVAQGGSGAATLTGILKGNGTSAFTAISAPTGAIVGTTDTQTLTNKTITATANYETRVDMSTGTTIDLSLGNWFLKTATASISTFTLSNAPSTPTTTAASFVLEITNGGAQSITWTFSGVASSIKWVGGTAPTLTSSGKDVLGFYLNTDGTWSGFIFGKDVK